MITVAIIAVNDDCQEQKVCVDYLKKEITKNSDINLIDTNSELGIHRILRLADQADKVILVFDAVRGNNASFTYVGRELFRKKKKPILLICSDGASENQLKDAKITLGSIWGYEDKTLDDTQLEFDTLYFSKIKGGVSLTPMVESSGVKDLIKALIG